MNKDELASRGGYWLERFWNERSVMERVICENNLTGFVSKFREKILEEAWQYAEDGFAEEQKVHEEMKEILDNYAEDDSLTKRLMSEASMKEALSSVAPWLLENRDPTYTETDDRKRQFVVQWLMDETDIYVASRLDKSVIDKLEKSSPENLIQQFLTEVPKESRPLAGLVALHVVYSIVADEYRKLEVIEQYLANVAQPMSLWFPDLYYSDSDKGLANKGNSGPWWKRKGAGRPSLDEDSMLEAVCSEAWKALVQEWEKFSSIKDPKTAFSAYIENTAKSKPFNRSIGLTQADEWRKKWLKKHPDKAKKLENMKVGKK